MTRPTSLAFALLAATSVGTATAAPTKGLTIEDMLAMQRVSDPAVSPDGKRVVFAVRDTDFDANKGRTHLWLATTDGSSVVKLTSSVENDTDPTWSQDGAWIYTRPLREGPAPFKSAARKPGRNDPCPCGSGKKYKQGCLLKA